MYCPTFGSVYNNMAIYLKDNVLLKKRIKFLPDE